jgi:O-antigen ligase
MGARRYQLGLYVLETFLLTLFLFVLPFNWLRPTALLLLLTIASWVFRTPVHRGLAKAAQQPGFWLLSALALMHLLTPLWGESLAELRQPVEQKTALLVLPLYFATTRYSRFEQWLWLRAFVLGCLALALGSFIVSTIQHSIHFPEIGPARYLTGQKLLWFLGVQRNRASLAVLVAAAIAAHHPALAILKKGRYVVTVFLVAYAIILTSKLYLLAIGLLLVVYGFRLPGKGKLVVAGVALGGLLAVVTIPHIRTHVRMLGQDLDQLDPSEVSVHNGVGVRYIIWQQSWKLIQERPLFGYGIKGSGDALERALRKIDFKAGHKHSCHNQFLELWLEMGIVAPLLLLSVFASAAWRAAQSGQWIFLVFLFLSFAGFTTSNMLERQMSILIFSFFLSFGWFGGLDEHDQAQPAEGSSVVLKP